MIAEVQTALAPPQVPATDFVHDFHPFTWQHLLSSVTCFAIMAVLVFLGRRWRGTPRELKLRRAWGLFAILSQTFELCWWCRPSFFRVEVSLPLQACDIAAWMAAFYLFRGGHVPRIILFYFGLWLSSQAFFTPVIGMGEGPSTMRFWLFFLSHSHIVGAALYDLIVLRFHPRLRDLGHAVLLGVMYTGSMMVLNRMIGNDANYGFTGPRDRQPGVVQLLGPYPMRVLWMGVVVTTWFCLVTAMWHIGKRATSKPQSR